MIMIDTQKTVDVYDNIHRLLYHFNRGHGQNDLSDLHHDIFLKIYDKTETINYIKSYLYKTCFWAHHNWLKNRDYRNKRKTTVDGLVLPDSPEEDTFQPVPLPLHAITVDSTVVVTFLDGRQSFYDSGTRLAKELQLSKSAVNEMVRNGGRLSWTTGKTAIVDEIKKLDYIHNPFKNGIKVVLLLSKSTFDKKKLIKKGWVLIDQDDYHTLYINKMNEGLIVKTNWNPFHGGTLVVPKVGISLKTFENNKSTKYVDYIRDDYHSNEYYEIWSNGTDAVLIKLKKKD